MPRSSCDDALKLIVKILAKGTGSYNDLYLSNRVYHLCYCFL